MELNNTWSAPPSDVLSSLHSGPATYKDQTRSLLPPLQLARPNDVGRTSIRKDTWSIKGSNARLFSTASPLSSVTASATSPPGRFKGTGLFSNRQQNSDFRAAATAAAASNHSGLPDTASPDSRLLLKHFRKQLAEADAAKASAELMLTDASGLDAQFALAHLTAAVLVAPTAAPGSAPTPAAAAAAAAVPAQAHHQAPSLGLDAAAHTQQPQLRKQQQQQQQRTVRFHVQDDQQKQTGHLEHHSESEAERQAESELTAGLKSRQTAHWLLRWRQAARQHRQEEQLVAACRQRRALRAWVLACLGRVYWESLQHRAPGQHAPAPFLGPLAAAKAQVADRLHHRHLQRTAITGWLAYVVAARQLQCEQQQAVHYQAAAAAQAAYQVAVADRFWRLRRLHMAWSGLRQVAVVAGRVRQLHGEVPGGIPVAAVGHNGEHHQQQEVAEGSSAAGPASGGSPVDVQGKVAALLARAAAKQQQAASGGAPRQAADAVPWQLSLRRPGHRSAPAAAAASPQQQQQQVGGHGSILQQQAAHSRLPQGPQDLHCPQQQQVQMDQDQDMQQQQQDDQGQGSSLLAHACVELDAVLHQEDPDEVLACLAALTQQLSVEALSREASAAEDQAAADQDQDAAGLQQQQQQHCQELQQCQKRRFEQQQQQQHFQQQQFLEQPSQQQQQQVQHCHEQQQQHQEQPFQQHQQPELLQQQQTSHTAAAGTPTATPPYRDQQRAGGTAAACSAAQQQPPRQQQISRSRLSRASTSAATSSMQASGGAPGSSRGAPRGSSAALHALAEQRLRSRAAADAPSAAAVVAAEHATIGSSSHGQGSAATDKQQVPAAAAAEAGESLASQQAAQEQEQEQPGCAPLCAEGSATAAVLPQLPLLPLTEADAQRLVALQQQQQRRERQQLQLLSQIQACLTQQQLLLAGMQYHRQLVRQTGLGPWRARVAWRQQQEDVAALWREQQLLQGALQRWRELMWSRRQHLCSRQAAAAGRLAAAARHHLLRRAFAGWAAWSSTKRHAQRARCRAALRAWRGRAIWVRGMQQQVAAGWARCGLRLALAGWRAVVSAQVRERLLWELQSDQRAQRFWTQHTARRVLAGWQAAAAAQQQERLAQLQHQHTWSKVRCWLLELEQAKGGAAPPAAAAGGAEPGGQLQMYDAVRGVAAAAGGGAVPGGQLHTHEAVRGAAAAAVHGGGLQVNTALGATAAGWMGLQAQPAAGSGMVVDTWQYGRGAAAGGGSSSQQLPGGRKYLQSDTLQVDL